MVNPFTNKTTTPSAYECTKLILMAPVAILRISAGIATLATLALSCKLITLGLTDKDLKDKPLSPLRRSLLTLALHVCGRTFLFTLGFHWISTTGTMATAKEAPIVVCNHTCMIDPFILGYRFCCSAVGAREHLSTPILGIIFRAQQLITVDRKDPNSRHEVKSTIRDRSKPGSPWPQQTLIFPEATCTNGTALITFRGGPFAPGVPVQPVVVRFPHVHFDPCWVQGGPGMMMIFYRLACQFHNFVEVNFLPPHIPNDQEKKNPIAYGNNVRQRMATVMNVPVTWHGYEDVRLQMEAIKVGLDANVGVVGMQGIKEVFGHDIRQATVQKHLKAFAAMDVHKTGHINFTQFAQGFGVEETNDLRHLFHLLDNDGSGQLDFREYLLGLALLNESKDRTDILKLAFQVFDADENGTMSIQELGSFLGRCGYSNIDVNTVFEEATHSSKGGGTTAEEITFEEFETLISKHPEYMKVFTDKLQKFA